MTRVNGEIVNPNEHLKIPDWINVKYFENILSKDEPDYKEVILFKPIAAIPPGQNFTSAMLRIHIDLKMKDGTIKMKSYIMKTMLADDQGGAIINETELFPKEFDMYQKFIPAFEQLYRSAGKNVQLAPKCLFTEKKDGRINFVFEDLKTKGLVNVDRLKGFNMEEMRRVLEKLAEYHAASVVYAEEHGPYPESFKFGFVDNKPDAALAKKSFMGRVEIFKAALADWGMEDAEKYIKKFPSFDQYWKCCERCFDVDSNVINVLNHGDFWSSNVMLNYLSNGAVDEILLVDFQMCKWGSPAEDLLFFISISAANDIRIKEYEHFVAIYHEHFIECLKLLNYKKRLPKLRELQMEMYKENNTFYAFFAVFNHLFLVLLPTDKDSNIATLMSEGHESNKFIERALRNPIFVEAVRELYPFYQHRGLFNFDDYENK